MASYLASCAASAAGYCACWTATGCTKAMMKKSARVAYRWVCCCGTVLLLQLLLSACAAPISVPLCLKYRCKNYTYIMCLCAGSCTCSFLFFLAIVISWVMRDFARPLLEKIPCKQLSRAQQQQQLCSQSGAAYHQLHQLNRPPSRLQT